MKIKFLLVVICISLSSCWMKPEKVLVSPDEAISLEFSLNEQGKPFYTVFFKNKLIIKENENFAGATTSSVQIISIQPGIVPQNTCTITHNK